jgi:putative ABC transport system substrate-binding protein
LIVAVAARYRVPAIYFYRSFAVSGGLISYGPDFAPQYPQAAEYIDRILKGEKPGDFSEAARTIRQPLVLLNASTDPELDAAFAALAQQRVSAMLMTADPFFDSGRAKIIAFAARQKLPAMYHFREYVIDGGLMSYGTSLAEAYREVGAYAAKILNGAKPSDLPVLQTDKFELVINLKTAKTLGLTIPASFLSLADELID